MDTENRSNTLRKVKLTANILFSGIGCQERGFEDSGLFDIEVLNTSDINKESVLSYAAIHCDMTNEMVEKYDNYPSREEMAQYLTDINLGYEPEKDKKFDWFKLVKKKSNDLEKYWLACKLTHNLGDISRIDELPYADFWTCSFPCFTGDTLVLTEEFGYVPIKEIKSGMRVLTHNNQYKNVLQSMKTGRKNIYKINAMCFDKIECTENHMFYTKTRHRVNTRIRGRAVSYRYFDDPQWKECKTLTKDDYLGYAINQKAIIPKWTDNNTNKIKLSPLMGNEDFWWIIGRYIADGFKQTSKTGSKIVLCCGKTKVHLCLIEEHLNKCGLNYCTDDHKSCINYHVCSNELYNFVSQFGDKAYGKFIPSFVFDMPIRLCEAFLNGYWSGDGCFTNNRYKATSISRTLIYGLGQLIAKTYHRPFSIYYTKRKPTCIIEGRIVNQKDTYSIVFSKDNAVQDKAFYSDGFIWFPINSIFNTKTIKDVYDISVEENHSFTANGAIVHNCTDISVAGKMKGLDPDSGTRSSLLWENIKLLKKAKNNNNLPKYIMVENVKNLVSKKFIEHFNNLISVFDDLGFNTYWSVINGKDCGVPQNRERCFVIAIRKDIDNGTFEFPQPFDTDIRLKDVLEETVDEKYYLSDVATRKFKLFSESKGMDIKVAGFLNPDKNVQDRVRVLDTDGVSQGLRATDYKDPVKIVSGIDKSIKDTQMIEYANCITAREDRGVSNRKSEGTAVLEQTNYPSRLGNIYGEDKGTGYTGNVWDSEKLSPTLTTMQGGNRQPMIVESGQIRPKDRNYNVHGTKREDQFETRKDGLSNALLTTAIKNCIREDFRIRKLTPRECFRLQGLTFEDCDKAKDIGVADTHLYKQAGNGIITNCCELLAEHLYKAQYDNTYICTDEKMVNFQKPPTD